MIATVILTPQLTAYAFAKFNSPQYTAPYAL